MDRVLFYLPTVTPWWFDNIVGHMIRALAEVAEVHVIVPPLWRNTGIGPDQLQPFMDGSPIDWHVVDADEVGDLRSGPADPQPILDLVRAIDPAHTFCRTADIATPAQFPGRVCHLLEAGAPPLSTPYYCITLQRDFWCHGDMPALSVDERAQIDRLFARTWALMRQRSQTDHAYGFDRAAALDRLGLENGRRIVALPLEYEHPEAFTAFHNRIARNIDLIAHVAEQIDDDMILAITDHPLNYRHVDNAEVYAAIEALGPRVRLVPNPEAHYYPTDLLIKHCDGLIVQNSKAIYSGAFYGKPTLRLSHRNTAPWMQVHDEFAPFLSAVRTGAAGVPEADARLWFGFHVMHQIISPRAITGAEILDRLERSFCVDRLADGLALLDAHERQIGIAA